ncbi:MAG: hypothetical protein HXX11_08890 [Desulfuromonadales bacterium]|nr:hypothetical protein [Desulfuromonadales bacterium]
MPQQPYAAIFPESNEPILILSLNRKQGRIPKGDYGFLELYCTDKGCDCRRVTIFVLNKKMEAKAVIGMGFDPDGPMPGPYLDDFHKQSPFADDLLQYFVDMINGEPDNLEMLHRHYREVRKKVEGKAYRGKPFPKPGSLVRTATKPPDFAESLLDVVKTASASVKRPSPASRKAAARIDRGTEPDLTTFVEAYHAIRENDRYTDHSELQHELRRYLLDNDRFGEELASLLVTCCTASNDEMVEVVLRILFDALEILRVELERKRKGAEPRMEQLQNALAKQVFLECGDAELCAAVSHILLQGRVEVLPVVHEANSHRLMAIAEGADEADLPGENPLENLFDSIREMAGNCPFEALESLLQVLALNPPQMQISLCGEMLVSDNALISDTAALMLLHPSSEVRKGVSALLSANAGSITPETLRRLIISRNWFPEEIRANIDTAISTARRSRIACAPLPKPLAMTIYASPIDGAAAQSFQVIVPDGKGFKSCSILLKRGEGVADAFVVPLAKKRELNEFLAMMNQEGAFIESSSSYLDLRLCHALSDGAVLGKAPNHWLLQVAEILGKDQWKALPFDPLRELDALREELETGSPELLADRSRNKSLRDSAGWCIEHAFAHSWFEDDAEVDSVIKSAFRKKGVARFSRDQTAIDAIFTKILEKRRPAWLERLTLCTLWLKSSRKPPVPWQQMFHLASMLADNKLKLARIPLMEMVANHTLGAHLERMEDEHPVF